MANKRLDYDKIYELVMQCRKAVCLTDSDVWITTLSQVPFITGYAGSSSMPVTTFRKRNAPAEMYLPQKDRMLSV